MTDTPMPDRTTPRPAGPERGMVELWLEDAAKVRRWMGNAKSTYDRRVLDLCRAVEELGAAALASPASPGAPVGDAPVTDPRDMDAAPPAGAPVGEREDAERLAAMLAHCNITFYYPNHPLDQYPIEYNPHLHPIEVAHRKALLFAAIDAARAGGSDAK